VIQTERDYYVSGRLITGKVHVHLSEDFPAMSLSLELKGEEYIYWISESLQDPSDSHTCRKTIISETLPLYKFKEGVLERGQYSFPFEVNLPDNCPSSCAIKEDSS
jgi:hypothetical protein